MWCFSLKGRELHSSSIEEVWNSFRRDGRLASLGEELGVIDLLAVDKRRDARADTNKFGVCVAQIHQDVDAVLFSITRKTSVV